MEQKIETKISLKEKMNNFYQFHKVKIFISLIILLIIAISTIFIQQKKEKNNILIAEKYVQAVLNLSQNKESEAKNLLNEIILSGNKFYSVLALNKIIEKNLFDNDEKILEYFNLLENLDFNEEELDLLIFKKALFLIKVSKNLEGNNLLERLIKKDSKFKNLAEDSIFN
tara:strand:- start:669 stop:1178 length:510 start_codon:yes stop_codon:yes gene_type:complete